MRRVASSTMSRQQPSNHIAQGGTAYRCLKSQAGLFNPGQTYPHQSKPRFSPTHLLTPVLGCPNLSKPDHFSPQHVSTFQVSPSHAFLSQLFNMSVHCTPIQTIAMLTYPVQSFSCHAFLPTFTHARTMRNIPKHLEPCHSDPNPNTPRFSHQTHLDTLCGFR